MILAVRPARPPSSRGAHPSARIGRGEKSGAARERRARGRRFATALAATDPRSPGQV